MTDAIVAAFALGVAGNLHCAGMCGPLAIAGCKKRVGGYLLGRLVSYALFGAMFARVGSLVGQFQGAALLLAAGVVFGRGLKLLVPRKHLVQIGQPSTPVNRYASWVANILPARGLGLGLATGAFPCGMLFAAWGIAASTGHAVEGALVMVVYSLVTLPGLLAPVLLTRMLPSLSVSRVWAGASWCALGLFMAVRPLLDAHQSH